MINKQTTVTRVHRPLMALLITVGAHSCPNAEAHHANVTSWGTLLNPPEKGFEKKRELVLKILAN